MSTTIPNLWPQNDVSVHVLSPAAILRAQASSLTQMTKGLLEGEVTSAFGEKGNAQYHLDVVAPALENYRHRLLTILQSTSQIYPIQFQGYTSLLGLHNIVAFTEGQFVTGLQKILGSGEVLSVLQSLISRSNEAQAVSVSGETAVQDLAA